MTWQQSKRTLVSGSLFFFFKQICTQYHSNQRSGGNTQGLKSLSRNTVDTIRIIKSEKVCCCCSWCRQPVSLDVCEQWEGLVVTHRVAAHLWGSGSPETGGPAAGRGPSSHAATGPQCAPVALCALPPAMSTSTWHYISWLALTAAAKRLVSFVKRLFHFGQMVVCVFTVVISFLCVSGLHVLGPSCCI